MRTTVTLEDSLLHEARQRAAARGTSVSAVIDDALRIAFARTLGPAAIPAIPIFTGGDGPMPGVDLTSNAALLDLLDEGVALDQQR